MEIVENDGFIEWDHRTCSLYILGGENEYLYLGPDEERIEAFTDKQSEYIFEEDVEVYLKSNYIFHEARGFLIHIPVVPIW